MQSLRALVYFFVLPLFAVFFPLDHPFKSLFTSRASQQLVYFFYLSICRAQNLLILCGLRASKTTFYQLKTTFYQSLLFERRLFIS